MMNLMKGNGEALQILDDWLIQAGNPSAPQSRVRFEILDAPFLNTGQQLWVVGAVPELGTGQPGPSALPLRRVSENTFVGTRGPRRAR
jgi:hypothetical protein